MSDTPGQHSAREPSRANRMPAPSDRFDAVLIAGGGGRRLGGVDKPGLQLGDQQLLDRVLDAAVGAEHRILVAGSDQPSADRAEDSGRYPDLIRCTEQPPGSGPLSALLTGARLTAAPTVLILAGDLPFIAPAIVPLLRGCATGPAVLVDSDGRANLLASAWPRNTLLARLEHIGDPTNQPMRRLIEGVDWTSVPDLGGWGEDCDTWADVERARDLLR
ncbi:molybdopterin-guanine dinucleotide biosynthesis protein A [Jatrophihabitans sp. GAS493]|uniref:molybdenum cofactor guanylyltransferase n=1 Tax=Jatrophihabitans sp. GAS493 TaxID=1907575 RepID=UPI000BC0DE3D|nr:NTP transferase domain-containing protein [Jatrophihabitans sp. GAS493]SOD73666.1 molybdopterin-guanine dinucleotide biosynthesis protein A [Jatrophihabitans sp. GAS493]